jgi:N-methylhydantoinase B
MMATVEGSNRRTAPPTRVDPITGAVIQGAPENIAIDMGHKLMRMSYSSTIRESEDFGAALTDADGSQLCECKMSTPLQSGPIPGYIRGVRARFAARGDVFRPGDVIMHNDPYGGASHGPDVAFCVPAFDGDTLLGFSVTTAHHLDIGARTPGSCGIVDAADTYAEGLQFKALKVFDQGRRNEPLWHMIRDNIRISDLVVGDMEAQIAAARIGAQRFLDLVRQYSHETVMAASADLMDYSERLMRAAIERIPDEIYRATTCIDGFPDDPEPSRRDLAICVAITVTGDELTVDLAGTAPQAPDRPINMPFEGTVDCAIWLTLRSILLDSVVYGPIPQNIGLTRPITIVAPKGCLANPIFPAPVIARFCPGNALADAVMRALAPAAPRQVSAGIGNLTVVAFSGVVNDQQWVHMEILEAVTAGATGSTAWMRWTRSTPTRATIRSRTSSRICRCASSATNCAKTLRRRASGAATSVRCASSSILATAVFRSRATVTNIDPGTSTAAPTARRARSFRCHRPASASNCPPRFPTARSGRASV